MWMAEKNGYFSITPLLAMMLAWLIPGAGHFYLGRRVRGVILFLAVTLTFWAGMAMGGVMTVDPKGENQYWFIGEMMTGANGLIGWHRYNSTILDLEREVDKETKNKSLSRPEAMERVQAEKNLALVAPNENPARAFCGVAGMLNLMCIFDAIMLALMGKTGEPLPEQPGKGQSET